MVGLVAMVSMIIAPQGSVALVRACPHRWGLLEVGEVLDNGQESVIGDVESSELGRIFHLLGLPVGALLALPLIAFLFGRDLSSRIPTLGG